MEIKKYQNGSTGPSLTQDKSLYTKVYNTLPYKVQDTLDKLSRAAYNFKNSAPGKVVNALIPEDATQAIAFPSKFVNEEVWNGLEDATSTLTKYHRGYNNQAPIFKRIEQTVTPSVESSLDWYYKLPAEMQRTISNVYFDFNGIKKNFTNAERKQLDKIHALKRK